MLSQIGNGRAKDIVTPEMLDPTILIIQLNRPFSQQPFYQEIVG